MAAWAYILECADGSYYTGCTTALDERFGQHQAGTYDGYTAARRPVVMVWADEFQTIQDAIAAERKIKGWSWAKKLALVEGRFKDLPGLSKNRQSHPKRDASFDTGASRPAQDDVRGLGSLLAGMKPETFHEEIDFGRPCGEESF